MPDRRPVPPAWDEPAHRLVTPARRRMITRRRRTAVMVAVIVLVAALGYGVTRCVGGPAGAVGDPAATSTWSETSSIAAPDATAAASSHATAAREATATATTDASSAGQGVAAPAITAVFPTAGSGRTQVLALPGQDSDRTGRRVRYTVEVEGGLPVPTDYLARQVREALTDTRGWEGVDGVHFVNVSPQQRAAGARADVRIIVASPAYVDRNCLPLRTMGSLSCHAGDRVLLNVNRWAHGADTYPDVTAYRTYLVNHEVGHALGHGHRTCPGPGRPAPLMVQQTKSLYGCTPWPWPQPPPG